MNSCNGEMVYWLLEKLKGRRKDMSQYDKFVNNYMASLTE